MTDILREALQLIVNRAGKVNGCENYTGAYTCRDEHSGRTRDSKYGATQWCDACVAADALDRTSELDPGEPESVTWQYGFRDVSVGGHGVTYWAGDGGLVRFNTLESARSTAERSVHGTPIIVRRPMGNANPDAVEVVET